MRYSAQIRAARALLGLRQEALAKAANIGLATLQRIEQQDGVVQGNFATVLKIQTALERSGIRFVDDDDHIGVLLAKNRAARIFKTKPI